MAEAAIPNIFLHSGPVILIIQYSRVEATHDHVHNININNGRYQYLLQQQYSTHGEMILSSRQAIFSFIVAVLVNLLQLMYQGKPESPFETRPKTMLVALTTFFTYCFSYGAKLRSSAAAAGGNINIHNTTSLIISYLAMATFGPLSLASISSLLFPENFGPFLYLAAIMYSFSLIFPNISDTKRAWNWLKAVIQSKFRGLRYHQRRGEGIVSVRLPPLQHAITGPVDIRLPV